MSSFKRILVAADGSPVSLRAVEHASRIAKHDGAELIVVHVVPKPSFDLFKSADKAADAAAYYEKARREAKLWLRDVESTAATHGVRLRVEILVDASSALEALLGYAEQSNVDLIVTGTRGRTPSTRILMGSVASGLVQYARCAVLVIR
ncbi:MAG: universal stress protein [Thaumarchaeota archaeon]|nr:universal stress protein [Nitrososphaerota archaeon]